MYNDERYYQELRDEYYDKIAEEERTIKDKIPTVQKAEDALSHHLQQLAKSGATLEDDVCEILRGVIEQAKAKERIPNLRQTLEEYQRELDNVRGL